MELDLQNLVRDTEKNMKRNLLVLFSLFFSGFCVLAVLVISCPDVPGADYSVFLELPNSNDKLRNLSTTVEALRDNSFIYTLTLFCYIYIYLQSFGIPGPIFLSQISGIIFGQWCGLLLVTFCATTGSSFCYLLSHRFGKGLIVRLFPRLLQKTNKVIQENKDKLLTCLIFLRVMPIIPNWMINLASPIIGVPFQAFVISTLIGLIPPNFLYATAGIALKNMQEEGMGLKSILILGGIGTVLMIPTLLKKKKSE